MMLYLLEPEVSGGHGEKTIYGEQKDIQQKGISGKVLFLHYEFDGWLGDEILESTPCFIITENLEQDLSKVFQLDYLIEDCIISTSEEFRELYYNKELPKFSRFKPVGTVLVENENYKDWSGHHFCLSQKGELVVTEEALSVLKQHSLNYCEITDLTLFKSF